MNSGFRDGETDKAESEGQIRNSDADDEAVTIELSVMAELSNDVNAREAAPKRNNVKKSPPQAVFSSTPQPASNGAADLGLACPDSTLEIESSFGGDGGRQTDLDQEEGRVENDKPAEIIDGENQFSSRAQMSRGTKAATGIGVENEVKLTQDPNQDYALSIRPVHSNRICVLQVLPDDQKLYERLVNRQWMFWPGIDLRFDGMWVRLPTSTMKKQ